MTNSTYVSMNILHNTTIYAKITNMTVDVLFYVEELLSRGLQRRWDLFEVEKEMEHLKNHQMPLFKYLPYHLWAFALLRRIILVCDICV